MWRIWHELKRYAEYDVQTMRMEIDVNCFLCLQAILEKKRKGEERSKRAQMQREAQEKEKMEKIEKVMKAKQVKLQKCIIFCHD